MKIVKFVQSTQDAVTGTQYQNESETTRNKKKAVSIDKQRLIDMKSSL